MHELDLTPFGFTPTESLVYEVLLTGGPGTGYAVARAAGLARANAYSALEGLVQKGGARVEGGRPKRYRPEPPAALLARISSEHGQAFDRLTNQLETVAVPPTPTLVEVSSSRGALQLIQHDVARANSSVLLVAPAEAYPLLAPALRRPAGQGLELGLYSVGDTELSFASVVSLKGELAWPGTPLISVVDERAALVATRAGGDVTGHWGSAPPFVSAARLAALTLAAGA